MTPNYQHNCDACKLLCSDQHGDWYVCPGDGLDRTLLLRKGQAVGDYSSGALLETSGKSALLAGFLLRGLVLTDLEARSLLAGFVCWDISREVCRIAPDDVNKVGDELRIAVMKTA